MMTHCNSCSNLARSILQKGQPSIGVRRSFIDLLFQTAVGIAFPKPSSHVSDINAIVVFVEFEPNALA